MRYALAALLLLAPMASTAAPDRPVVVELFTSQGCSSCPPADAILARLGERDAIIPLAWHVDYWDRLGWPDPFAAPAHTARQRTYARVLGGGLYTPELVIDGRAHVVGSRARDVERAVDAAAERPRTAKITAHLTRDGRTYTLRPTVTGASPGAVVLAALTESGLSTDVQRGENGGRTLTHAHVVRAFATGKAGAPLTLTAPPGVALDRARVVVLVSHPTTRAIEAATRATPASK